MTLTTDHTIHNFGPIKYKVYQHQQEIWNYNKCLKHSKKFVKDSYGTKCHYAGAMDASYTRSIYNGGTVIDNEWYDGENYPLPALHKDFEYEYINSWGIRLKLKERSGRL